MKKTLSDKIGMFLFLLPALILFGAFFIYPICFVASTSLLNWDGMGSATFAGLKNYVTLFHDNVFLISIRNNILWALAGGFIQIPLATMVALLLAKKPRGWKALRTIYFFPNIISGLALAMMWSAVYNSEYGILNGILKILGLSKLERNWLGDIHTALPAVLIYGIFYIGYYMVIILAEISSIPETYYEAADIDGASKIQQDLYITLPLIKGALATCTTLVMVYGLRQFEQVYLLTNGGPDNTTSTMVLYLFKGLQNFNYGLANASGVILIIIGAAVIITVRKLFDVRKYEM